MASAVSNIRAKHAGNARFNEEALSWDSRPFVHEASQAASQAILSKLSNLQPHNQDSQSSGLQVLEIGCGTGILSFLMAKDPSIARIVAVDAAEGMIEVLKTKLSKDPAAAKKIVPVAILLEDPEDSALPPAAQGAEGDKEGERQKFDLITSHLVLHHIPDLKAVLETMYGCLAQGGRVMLTDFEDFGPQAKRFHPVGKMDGVARHGIQKQEMEVMLREVGFEEVEVRAEWRMEKKVERFNGEFEKMGSAEFAKVAKNEDVGEIMEFPFVVCCGVKR
ncbi:hypothetical protein BST61_g1671 [Cercospora zeina]